MSEIGTADYSVTFDDIEKAEKRRLEVINESKVTHEMTVKQWDILYEAILKLAKTYEKSDAFMQSQIGKRWFQKTEMSKDVR